MYETVAIIGCGGVGSNLAYMITRTRQPPTKIVLIDNDTIDGGNLSRQMFASGDAGQNKAEALASMLRQMAPSITIEAYPLKIENETDLACLQDIKAICVCTDNMESKRLIERARAQGILYRKVVYYVACEETYFEIKTALERQELATWSFEAGYNSNQTAFSNMSAAFMLYHCLTNFNGHVFCKIHTRDFWILLTKQMLMSFESIELTNEEKEFKIFPLGVYARGVSDDDGEPWEIENVPKIKFVNKHVANHFLEEFIKNKFHLFSQDKEIVGEKKEKLRAKLHRERMEAQERPRDTGD